MKSIFTVAGLSSDYGGPSHSVPALAGAMARSGVQVELITCETAAGQGKPLLPPDDLIKSHILPHANRTTRWLPRANAFVPLLKKLCAGRNDCVIHDNGLWLPTNHAAAYASRELKCPLLISPRGMLSDWALQHKGWKKRLAWAMYQRRDLQGAKVLHATSRAEAEGFRRAGLAQPVAVIPNGVELPGQPRAAGRGPMVENRTLLFLGRIHPVKGLLHLVEAWAQLKPAGWRVVLAGQSEAGHQGELLSAMRRLGVEQDFTFAGAVNEVERWKLYRAADVFVLPSHSENFGIVVAEALATGVPVIATKGTPWQDLATHRCGWWVDMGVEPLAGALRLALGLTDEERLEMGRRGRKLVEDNYSWDGVAREMQALYEWMLGSSQRPQCLVAGS